MKEIWSRYAQRFEALQVRERIMIFIAAAGVLFLLADSLFITPAATRRKAFDAQAAQQQSEINTLIEQFATMERKLADPDAAMNVRREDLRRQIAEIDGSLKDMQQHLVPAHRMKALLQGILARNPRLQLVEVVTLPVAPLVDKPAAGEAAGGDAVAAPPTATEANIFRHGMQITLQGSYADLYDYLKHVESQPSRMFWSRASLDARQYPRLTMTLTLYTLSLDKAWLEV